MPANTATRAQCHAVKNKSKIWRKWVDGPLEPLANLLADADAVLADAAREDQRVHLAVEPNQVRPQVLPHALSHGAG